MDVRNFHNLFGLHPTVSGRILDSSNSSFQDSILDVRNFNNTFGLHPTVWGGVSVINCLRTLLMSVYILTVFSSKQYFMRVFFWLTFEVLYRWLVLTVIMFLNKAIGSVMVVSLSLMYFCNICLNEDNIEDGIYDWISSYSSPLLTQFDRFAKM